MTRHLSILPEVIVLQIFFSKTKYSKNGTLILMANIHMIIVPGENWPKIIHTSSAGIPNPNPWRGKTLVKMPWAGQVCKTIFYVNRDKLLKCISFRGQSCKSISFRDIYSIIEGHPMQAHIFYIIYSKYSILYIPTVIIFLEDYILLS